MERSVETEGPFWGHGAVHMSYPSHIYSMEPAHGEAGGGGGGQLPAGCWLQCPLLPLHMQTCMFTLQL